MKKLLLTFLAALLTVSFAACGKSETAGGESAVKNSLDLLTTVWDSHADEEKFPAAGGDMENPVMDGPGAFSTADAAALDGTLGLPEASAEKIDEAASLVHMMNANTFTCGVFHLKAAGDAQALADAIKDNLAQRQWMCGFPDKLVIMGVDGYVVSFFGAGDIVDTFRAKVAGAYASAEVLCDQPIA